jgi:hypothetical protein
MKVSINKMLWNSVEMGSASDFHVTKKDTRQTANCSFIVGDSPVEYSIEIKNLVDFPDESSKMSYLRALSDFTVIVCVEKNGEEKLHTIPCDVSSLHENMEALLQDFFSRYVVPQSVYRGENSENVFALFRDYWRADQ